MQQHAVTASGTGFPSRQPYFSVSTHVCLSRHRPACIGSDTARLWTSLTAAAVGTDAVAALPSTVPDHAYFPLYGPDFRMATREKKTLPDRNDGVFLTR